MGWMTLHSVATCYPETPSQSERELMYSWLDMFRDTITCPTVGITSRPCFRYTVPPFRTMLQLASGVRDLYFPSPQCSEPTAKEAYLQLALEDCMTTLQTNVKTRSAANYRVSYLDHITKYWRSWQDVTGIVSTRGRSVRCEKLRPPIFRLGIATST
jgi:hypothetical protein